MNWLWIAMPWIALVAFCSLVGFGLYMLYCLYTPVPTYRMRRRRVLFRKWSHKRKDALMGWWHRSLVKQGCMHTMEYACYVRDNPWSVIRGFLVLAIAFLMYTVVALASHSLSLDAITLIEDGISFVLLKEWGLPRWTLMYSEKVALFASATATLWIARMTYRWFMVKVPEFTAHITVSYFGGIFRKLGTGLHLKFPWEESRESMWFVMEVIAISFELICNTKDGGQVKAYGVGRYKASWPRLPNYAEVAEDSIGEALLGEAKSKMTQTIGEKETAQVPSAIGEIQNIIRTIYGDIKKIAKIEREMGVDFIDITLSKIEFIGKTRDILDVSFTQTSLFKGLMDKEHEAARNDILILLGKNAEKKINVNEILLNITGLKDLDPEVLKEIAKAFGVASPALAAYAGASAGKSKGGSK